MRSITIKAKGMYFYLFSKSLRPKVEGTEFLSSKVDEIINNEKFGDAGEIYLYSRVLKLGPFAGVSMESWKDWECDPLGDRSWQWRLNWLSFLSPFISFHHRSGDDRALTEGLKAIDSWASQYLDTDVSHPFEFAWHDHGTALRVEQLLCFWYYATHRAPGWALRHADELQELLLMAYAHGKVLARQDFYSRHTNHGLEQARVLLMLGAFLHGSRARKWCATAVRRIDDELDFAFTAEGVHVENSPAYHIFVFKVFLSIIRDYPSEFLGDLSNKLNAFSCLSLEYIARVLRPDGKLPPIGDTEQLETTDSYKESYKIDNCKKTFEDVIAYQNFRFSHSRGKSGVAPASLNKVYPRSGYAIFRSSWPAAQEFHKAFHVVVKVGSLSRYHYHQDEGHVSVYAGGEDWLIDSGMYNYRRQDPIRKYMRSRVAHNVPMISGAGYHSQFSRRLSAWKVVDYSEDESAPFVEMKIDVLEGVSHRRRVTFLKKDSRFEINDVIVCHDGVERDIKILWHTPRNKKILVNKSEIHLESRTGNTVNVIIGGDKPDAITHSRGKKGDKIHSCISYQANQVEDSNVIKLVYDGRREIHAKMVFDFSSLDLGGG